jgi:hypothetical protein
MARGFKTGGRTKGTPNKRHELQELLDAVFERVDPIEKLTNLLNQPMDKGVEARVLLRLLEYRYGQPQQRVELTGANGGAIEHTISFVNKKSADESRADGS